MKKCILILLFLLLFTNMVSANEKRTHDFFYSQCKSFENITPIDLTSNYVYLSGDFMVFYYKGEKAETKEGQDWQELYGEPLYNSTIFTLTYVDPFDDTFYATGHSIVKKDVHIKDNDLNELSFALPVGFDKANDGKLGILEGVPFFMSPKFGVGTKNYSHGVSGKLFCEETLTFIYDKEQGVFSHGKPGEKNVDMFLQKYGLLQPIEVSKTFTKGKAYIYTTLPNEGKRYIEIDILSTKENKWKYIDFKVKDKEYMDTYGGILQGMSGSPIIQDGKLIGALSAGYTIENDKGCFSTISRVQPDFFEKRENMKRYVGFPFDKAIQNLK